MLVQPDNTQGLLIQRGPQAGSQGRGAVLAAFAAPDMYGSEGAANVLDPQRKALGNAQPAPVERLADGSGMPSRPESICPTSSTVSTTGSRQTR